MKPTSRLTLDFAQRMVTDLSTNNVLRGAWAEQVVAHYLSIEKLPPNWSYYDMRDADGRDISVKHSVGPRPSFSVGMSKWAWDHELAEAQPGSEGWRGGDAFEFQYWCHVYVFAWLEADSSAPELDIVLDCDRWQFAVLSRNEMYRAFVTGKPSPQRTVGLAALRAVTTVVSGLELPAAVNSITFEEEPGVPPRIMDVTYAAKLGAPVEPTSEVVPEVVAGAQGVEP